MDDVNAAQGARALPRFPPARVVCAALAVVVSLLATVPLLRAADGNLTALIRMTAADPIAPLAQRLQGDFSFVPAGHYDGVYYYAIAIDPLARGEAHTLIDLPSHRYGHPGYGWLAWFASFGRPEAVPAALLILSLIGMATAGYLASAIAVHLGASPWWGLAISFNPGLVFSVTTDTSEAVSAAIMAAGVLLWLRGRLVPAVVCLAALCFFKFQLILVPIGLALWELISFFRGTRSIRVWRTISLLAIGPILFVLWEVYVSSRFGESAVALGPSLLSVPPFGFLQTMADLAQIHEMDFNGVQIASAEIPILACLFAAFVAGCIRAVRLRDELDAVFLLQAALVLSLNYWNLYYPKDLIRTLALPLLLLIVVMRSERLRAVDHE